MKRHANLNEKLQNFKKTSKKILAAPSREYLNDLDAHKVRATKKALLKIQAELESEVEIEEFLEGKE